MARSGAPLRGIPTAPDPFASAVEALIEGGCNQRPDFMQRSRLPIFELTSLKARMDTFLCQAARTIELAAG